MTTQNISFPKKQISSILSSRKMTLEQLAGIAEIHYDNVIFPSSQVLRDFSDHIAVPLSVFYQEEPCSDLEHGVKIARYNKTYSRDEIRDGVHYYTYHHLVTTKEDPGLMALRVDVHSNETQPLRLNSGHGSCEVVYVTRGTVRVQWLDDMQQFHEEILYEGDSIFITPFVPHSFINHLAQEKSEIIAINYE